ncbi:unnamed protein product, partial [Ilex paraguariensis]
SESREGYEVVVECVNEIIAKLKDVTKARCEAQVTSSTRFDDSLNNNGAKVFVDNSNVTKVVGLKRKDPKHCGNTRLKSSLEKASKSKKKASSMQPAPTHVQLTMDTGFKVQSSQESHNILFKDYFANTFWKS